MIDDRMTETNNQIQEAARNYVPGKPTVMTRNDFTHEVQQGLWNSNLGVNSPEFASQHRNEQPSQAESQSTDEGQVSISREEYENLQRAQELVQTNEVASAFGQTLSPKPQNENSTQSPTEQPSDSNTQSASNDSSNWFDSILGGDSDNSAGNQTQPQEPKLERNDLNTSQQPQNENVNQHENDLLQQLSTASLKHNLDPRKVQKFTNSLDGNDYVELFLAVEKAIKQNQNTEKTTPQQASPNLVEQPGKQQVPLYRGLMQNTGNKKSIFS